MQKQKSGRGRREFQNSVTRILLLKYTREKRLAFLFWTSDLSAFGSSTLHSCLHRKLFSIASPHALCLCPQRDSESPVQNPPTSSVFTFDTKFWCPQDPSILPSLPEWKSDPSDPFYPSPPAYDYSSAAWMCGWRGVVVSGWARVEGVTRVWCPLRQIGENVRVLGTSKLVSKVKTEGVGTEAGIRNSKPTGGLQPAYQLLRSSSPPTLEFDAFDNPSFCQPHCIFTYSKEHHT